MSSEPTKEDSPIRITGSSVPQSVTTYPAVALFMPNDEGDEGHWFAMSELNGGWWTCVSHSITEWEPLVGHAELAAAEKRGAIRALREAAQSTPFPADPYGVFDHESLRAARVQITNYLHDHADRIERGDDE